MLTEATMPTVGQTTIFTGASGATITKTYTDGEVQNNIVTTDWTLPATQANNGSLTVTGTYGQYIGILNIDAEYTKG